jgi:hypothetical protein
LSFFIDHFPSKNTEQDIPEPKTNDYGYYLFKNNANFIQTDNINVVNPVLDTEIISNN